MNATVIIRRFKESDELLLDALESLRLQVEIELQVVVQDHEQAPAIAAWVLRQAEGRVRFEYEVFAETSLSRCRNRGVARAQHDFVLFSEPDALPEPRWAKALSEVLASGASIAGSCIMPVWKGHTPYWTRVGFVREQYSLLDLGPGTLEVSKVFGASFGLDRRRVPTTPAGEIFSSSMGRRGGRLFGGEETDLCARVRANGGRVVYTGQVRVGHQVLPERLSYAWIARRFYYAGRGRAQRGGAPNPAGRVAFADLLFSLPLLPWYVVGVFRERLTRRR